MGHVHKCQQDQNRASENWEHQPTSEQLITLQGQTLEEVQSFPYLGSEEDQSGKVRAQRDGSEAGEGRSGGSDVEKEAIPE